MAPADPAVRRRRSRQLRISRRAAGGATGRATGRATRLGTIRGQPTYQQPGPQPRASGPVATLPAARPSAFGGPQSGRSPTTVPPQPPPRRRSPLRLLLLGLIGLVVLALAGLVVANLVAGTSNVAYQNDDYEVPPPDKNPPPIPLPADLRGGGGLVGRRTRSTTSPCRSRCAATAQPINVADGRRRPAEDALRGPDGVPGPGLAAPGDRGRTSPIVRPTVTIYGREINTKCGKSGVNAFYCSADQQIYFSNQLPRAVPIVAQDKWAADVVMAHEFGHAIQGRTGLADQRPRPSPELRQQGRVQPVTSGDWRPRPTASPGMFMRSVSRRSASSSRRRRHPGHVLRRR